MKAIVCGRLCVCWFIHREDSREKKSGHISSLVNDCDRVLRVLTNNVISYFRLVNVPKPHLLKHVILNPDDVVMAVKFFITSPFFYFLN